VLETFKKAEDHLKNEELEEAAAIYLSLADTEFAPYCYYRLAAISNMTGDPTTAYSLYYRAFEAKPDIAQIMYSQEHTSYNYVYRGKAAETVTETCPLCGGKGLPYWCYPLSEAPGFNHLLNPIRLWMYCDDCHHLFAGNFPIDLPLFNDAPRKVSDSLLSYYSNILSKIRQYTTGMNLFEVGIGAGEFLLVAREVGYETSGIDIIRKHVECAQQRFNLDVDAVDFIDFQTGDKFDVIIMGDVLEHVSDPVAALQKVADLLDEGGVLWLSTPNFDSAFAQIDGHADVMRRQQYHQNYFSRESLYRVLLRSGLAPVDYDISSHYGGSMEIVSMKNIFLE
jgi:2-polyprenyl-3-methyl-5-hydroxy-6-metoxy-1,4-benzoquinol methylase